MSLSARPDRQEELHFAEVLHKVGVTEIRAIADLKALAHEPATAEGRAEYVRRIRTTVLPEWNQLYESIDNAQVPPSSTEAVLKERLLRYYGDMSKAMQMTADMADKGLHDPGAKAEIKALLDYAKRQLAALGAAPL